MSISTEAYLNNTELTSCEQQAKTSCHSTSESLQADLKFWCHKPTDLHVFYLKPRRSVRKIGLDHIRINCLVHQQ